MLQPISARILAEIGILSGLHDPTCHPDCSISILLPRARILRTSQMPKPIPIPISGMQAAIITNPRKKSPGEDLSSNDIPFMTR